jgi:phosphate/sulfate permease
MSKHDLFAALAVSRLLAPSLCRSWAIGLPISLSISLTGAVMRSTWDVSQRRVA